MNQTSTYPDPSGPKSLTIEDMEKAINLVRGIKPVQWIMISPNGTMFTGPDPWSLAIASSEPHPALGTRLMLNPGSFG